MNRRALLKFGAVTGALFVSTGIPKVIAQTIPNMFIRKRVTTNELNRVSVGTYPIGSACIGGPMM